MESSSEDPRKSRTILRSVIDAFRGTPTVNTSVGVEIEEVGFEDEFNLASRNARNFVRSELVDSDELRCARETDETAFETFERTTVQEPQAWKDEYQARFSTDPRRANRIAQKADISDFILPPHDDIRARQEDFTRNGSSTDPRVNVRNVLPTHLSPLPSPASLPRANYSVRKSLGDPQNITVRESRQPKERQRDKDYRRATLSSANGFPITLPLSGPVDIPEQAPRLRGSPARSVPSPLLGSDSSSGKSSVFEINLICNGQTVRHEVYDSMPVAQLMDEARAVFTLAQCPVILMLFGMTPSTLDQSRSLSGPPRVGANATVFVIPVQIFGPANNCAHPLVPPPGSSFIFPPNPSPSASGLMSSKLLGAFKLPKFDGSPRHWKVWERSLQRYLGLHQLDHVLQDGFLSSLPQPDAVNANKIVYFLIEEAVAVGTLAAKYVRQAPKWSGHEAYILLYNRFVFSGPQTAAILLAELTSIRFLRDETASGFCMRLVELLEELETVPGSAAVCMNDTQKLGYLLSAIRHETDLQSVYVQLQADQLRGNVTFEQACDELHHRCDAIRADEYMDTTFHGGRKVLVSTELKKIDKLKQNTSRLNCLTKDCLGMIVAFLPFCKSCYLQCTSGKIQSLVLRDNLGVATYDLTTQRIVFPPASRIPVPGKGKRKGLMVGLGSDTSALTVADECGVVESNICCLFSNPGVWDKVMFFVDSGAGQCLCSSSSCFSQMSPCCIEITGISGSLQAHGSGTALFLAQDDNGNDVILRVHNCLYCYGDFNLISVSQFQQLPGNSVDFRLGSSSITMFTSGNKRQIRVPLVLDDGLFALDVEPFQLDDSRYRALPKCDVTPRGDFILSQSDSDPSHWWISAIVSKISVQDSWPPPVFPLPGGNTM